MQLLSSQSGQKGQQMSDDTQETQDIQGLMGGRQNMLFGAPKGAQYRYYFYGPVKGPERYIDLINVMDGAQEGDEIHLMINTPGGRLDATLSIIHAMNRTKAHVVCHADGDVASAGSIIFFNGHSWVVNPYSTFMLHDGSGGVLGKIGQNVKAAVSIQENLDYLYRSVYKDFFSDEEIDEILSGSDHYSNADQIADRVESVMESRRSETASPDNLKAILEAMGYDKDTIGVVADLVEEPNQPVETEPDDIPITDEMFVIDNPGTANHGRKVKVIEDNGGDKVKVEVIMTGKRFWIKLNNLES